MSEYEKMEMQAFDLEFNQLIADSATIARKEVGNILSS